MKQMILLVWNPQVLEWTFIKVGEDFIHAESEHFMPETVWQAVPIECFINRTDSRYARGEYDA